LLLGCSLVLSVAGQPGQPDPKTAKVAVIGAGIGGVTTVIELIEAGFEHITLYEKSNDLLSSTSSMIAATVNFDAFYREDWKTEAGLGEAFKMFSEGNKIANGRKQRERWFEFMGHSALSQVFPDQRSELSQRKKIFRISRQRLIHHIKVFSARLCEAAIGYWCCEAGDLAKAKIEEQGLKCPEDPNSVDSPFGLFQLAHDVAQCDKFKEVSTNEVGSDGLAGATNTCDDSQFVDEASCVAAGHFWVPLSYSYYNNSETVARVPGFLQADTEGKEWCSMVEHQLTGYVRTEHFFEIIGELFTANPNVTILTGCGVQQLVALGGVNNQIRIDPSTTENDACVAATFDKVVVSANLGAVPLFKDAIDPKLDRHLFGLKGYGLSGKTNDTGVEDIKEENAGRSVHYIDHGEEFQAAYARAMENDKVKIWGGHDASFTEFAPPYAFCDAETEDHIFELGPASAKDLITDPDTIKQTGMRPIPSLGQAPMIKRYEGEWENVFLNTGYGYNGFDLAWFSSMCTVDWLKTNTHNLDRCKEATAIGQESSVWIGWYFILLITFIVIFVLLIICALYPICYFCTTKEYIDCSGCINCLYGKLCPCCNVDSPSALTQQTSTSHNNAAYKPGEGMEARSMNINGDRTKGNKTDTMSSAI